MSELHETILIGTESTSSTRGVQKTCLRQIIRSVSWAMSVLRSRSGRMAV